MKSQVRAVCFDSGMRHDDADTAAREVLRHLGIEVRAARYARGWSQRRLEETAGIDQTTICRAELGKAPGLRLASFARMLAALGASFRIDGR